MTSGDFFVNFIIYLFIFVYMDLFFFSFLGRHWVALRAALTRSGRFVGWFPSFVSETLFLLWTYLIDPFVWLLIKSSAFFFLFFSFFLNLMFVLVPYAFFYCVFFSIIIFLYAFFLVVIFWLLFFLTFSFITHSFCQSVFHSLFYSHLYLFLSSLLFFHFLSSLYFFCFPSFFDHISS